jgi:hypothetical protein
MPLLQKMLREVLADKATAATDHYFHKTIIAGEKALYKVIRIKTSCKIPPSLPLPKGVIMPLFSKEGKGEIFHLLSNSLVKLHTLTLALSRQGRGDLRIAPPLTGGD